MTLGEISDQKTNTTLPSWIYANTNLNIMNLSYNNFTASNIEGDISYKNNILNSNTISATTLNGKIDGSFILKEPKNKHLQLQCNLNARKINIRNCCY